MLIDVHALAPPVNARMSSPALSTAKLPFNSELSTFKSRRPWYRRTRKLLPLLLLLSAVLDVAVAAPLVSRRNKRSLYFPAGAQSGVLGAATVNQTYDSLIVTGSSYSDDAHPRPANLAGTLAGGSSYWVGVQKSSA